MAACLVYFDTKYAQGVELLPSTSATTTGVWFDTTELASGSIEFILAGTATLQLRGSNAQTKPADAADGTQIDVDITATVIRSIEHCPRYLKVKVSAWSSGACTANAVLHKHASS